MRAVLLMFTLGACGAAAPRALSAPRRATSPCRSVGTGAESIAGGGMLTLGDGDGVLISQAGDERPELSWWSHGTCQWRTSLPRWGAGNPVAARDTVWVRTFTDQEHDLHEEWSEIDATGRVLHAFRSPPYVHGLVPQDDGSVLIVRGILGTQEVWRIAGGRATLLAHVPLADTFWEFDVVPAGAGAVAVLATTSMTGVEPAQLDPRLIVPGRFETVLAHGTFPRGTVGALADGGWLVTLNPLPDRRLMLIRVDERGAIVWTATPTMNGEASVQAIDSDGTVDVVISDVDGSWQLRRLVVDLATGQSTVVDRE